ncbi:putative sugar O-methyltransferase [Akkermansiaceae bacterium]|nr:putative sugar O-methyltransferase [Akkermansiaceae bacterium]
MRQNSYIRLSDQLHPDWEKPSRFYSELNKPDVIDYQIVDEIITINKTIGAIDMGGAWKFYNENTRKNYVNALRNNDRETLANLLPSFFQNECSSAIITPSINVAKDFNLSNQMMWDLDAFVEFTTNDYDLSILNSPCVGSPFGIELNGNKISPDSARHLFFAENLKSLTAGNILEIGGGYGGLIYFLRKIGFNENFFNIDLPETLFVCYYYLKKNNIRCEFLIDKRPLEKGVVYLIPSVVYKDVVNNIEFDTFFNSASLSEMDKKVCFNYIEMVNRKSPNHILHCNSNFLAFPDSKIHIEVLAKDFPIDSKIYNLVYKHVSPFQGASGRYRIFSYKKSTIER